MRTSRPPDGGFTMAELMVAIALLGLMAALAIGGYARWATSSAHVGTAREIQTTMRQAHQQAVTEGRATCVWFDTAASTYAVYRGTCESPTKTKLSGPLSPSARSISIADPAFSDASGSSAGVTFYARGTATTGHVEVVRSGSTKVYLLSVEGLTGRVSLA